uniref:Leukemia NUP98 fusion partner 1 n=1 Tax=Astyanax mexicanus TaxID=7994 RepID=A0A8B9JMM0_ASTMX
MDNDEDDDGNFTKWMSSYWGHGAGEESAKERKRSFRRPARNTADRRASLPCMITNNSIVLHLHRFQIP